MKASTQPTVNITNNTPTINVFFMIQLYLVCECYHYTTKTTGSRENQGSFGFSGKESGTDPEPKEQ